jgi:hypothetical protein
MNMSGRNSPVDGRRGVTLIEVLIYVVLFYTFMMVAADTYICGKNQARSIRWNATKIVRVMYAGERWRQDIRDAISPPQNIQSSLPNPDDPLDIIELTSLKIIKSSETNWYAFRGDHVFRMSSHLPTQWELVMDKVNGSTMVKDQRGKVAAWRWEVELKKITKKGRTRPLFTFLAAPQKPQDP